MSDGDVDPTPSEAPSAARLDALPYVDPMDEDYDAYALTLVEEDMQCHSNNHRIDDLAPVKFTTELFRKEYGGRSHREGPLPLLFGGTEEGRQPLDPSDTSQLQEAVRQARVAYERERLRAVLMGVEKIESGPLWKATVELLSQSQAAWEQRLEAQRQAVEQLNALRQSEQEAAGRELARGESQFRELVAKRLQLQEAIATLEAQLSTGSDEP